ncbi:putative transposase [Georgenia yuyongxinii]
MSLEIGTSQVELDAMPEPGVLARVVCDEVCVVTWGRLVVYRYAAGDIGMRNLAIVALTDAGLRIDEVAKVFALTATYVSMLRGRATREGSAGLARRRGRPAKLDARQRGQVRRWAGQGRSQEWIAGQFGVARSMIGRVLAELGPVPVQCSLDVADADVDTDTDTDTDTVESEAEAFEQGDGALALGAGRGSARVAQGTYECRYAGAMLTHAFLDRVGAQEIFASVTGAPGRRYDDVAVLTATTLGFALGADTIEGTKHLRRADAGVMVGLSVVPELRTWRPRLGALADGSDPLALQRAFAAGMLAADPAGDPVYFVDDHFVAYSGAQPVAKGYNTRRRLAEPGRADTVVCDARGRAVLFASGEPSGLTKTMPAVLDQLREVTGPGTKLLLGFDRGGSYPAAFTACNEAGMDWITYRRGALAPATGPVEQHTASREGRQISVDLVDEEIEIAGYGPARQLTLVEADQPVLQILTSHTTADPAALVYWLRARWRIENTFKYAAQHNGINALADYTMDTMTNTAKVPHPARTAARKKGHRGRGATGRRRTGPGPDAQRARHAEGEERRPARHPRQHRHCPPGPGRREEGPGADPSEAAR